MLKSEHLDDKWVRVDDEKKRIYYYLENLDNVICYLERIKIPDGNKTLLDFLLYEIVYFHTFHILDNHNLFYVYLHTLHIASY